ncbi:unnamed protein product [Microthlaspi erraticum]|uniref:RRM domain-containing protein n=1 Tax=Microthlaspi erraticum TaxID=1685480 RepID=A0A6D2JHD9_9BRAS|nr:unnamed protein product [Microthlaspi erraticum]
MVVARRRWSRKKTIQFSFIIPVASAVTQTHILFMKWVGLVLVLRFAFIEFTNEVGARAALSLSGTMVGFYPVKVMPSKTAIAMVNSTFLPRSEDEREMCARTIYCTNIDKKVTQQEIKLFFESVSGEVYHLRLFGDYHHPTRIGFVEFFMKQFIHGTRQVGTIKLPLSLIGVPLEMVLKLLPKQVIKELIGGHYYLDASMYTLLDQSSGPGFDFFSEEFGGRGTSRLCGRFRIMDSMVLMI